MLADHRAFGSLDGTGLPCDRWRLRNSRNGRSPMKQMPVLSGLSNTGRPAAWASRRTSSLRSSPSGKQSLRQRGGRHAVQEIALVLGAVRRLQQPCAVGAVLQPGVVSGGDPRGAQPLHVFQANAEFDFPVAEHVRIGRAAGGVFAQKVGEHALAVLGRKAHPVQGDAPRCRTPCARPGNRRRWCNSRPRHRPSWT